MNRLGDTDEYEQKGQDMAHLLKIDRNGTKHFE